MSAYACKDFFVLEMQCHDLLIGKIDCFTRGESIYRSHFGINTR